MDISPWKWHTRYSKKSVAPIFSSDVSCDEPLKVINLQSGVTSLISKELGVAKVIALFSFKQPSYPEQIFKRLMDLGLSFISILLLSPVLFFIAIITKLTSSGPVFYTQQRIGKDSKEFTIYKFRSMFINAERFGPMLSFDNDPRITAWGKLMRKWKLDELPQLWNVLIGDMSLVGPRPERKFYIDKIKEHCPEIFTLLKVKPGLTSLGMVKYGYASSPDEILQRIEFDKFYLMRFSLLLDIKIILLTIHTVLLGKGK